MPRTPRTPRYKLLAFPSFLCCVFGIAYTPLNNLPPRPLPAGLDIASLIIPLWMFGVVWLVVGIFGWVAIARRRIGAGVFSGQMGMFATYCVSYLLAWVFGDPFAWISAAVFLTLTGVVWYAMRIEPPLFLGRTRWIKRWGR